MSIYTKLLRVQEEVQPIKKTEDNPFFKSKYFDVNGILAALKPILSKHGLVLTQGIEANSDHNVLETVVTDAESGEHIGSHAILPDTIDPQKFGSAVTYFRRYALQSLFALEAEDDDANASIARPTFSVEKKDQHPDQYTPPARRSWKPKTIPNEENNPAL